MPEFRHPDELAVDDRGEGWTLSTLADARHVPGMAMSARLWRLEPGATGPEQAWDEAAERFLYVVSGGGELLVGGETKTVGREDVVWIERGDRFRLSCGAADGLVVLDAKSA